MSLALEHELPQSESLLGSAKEAIRELSYDGARSEGALAFFPSVARLEPLLGDPDKIVNPTDRSAARQVRDGVAKMVALSLLSERAASEDAFLHGGTTAWSLKDMQTWLSHVVTPGYLEALDVNVTGALERSLWKDTQTTVGRLDERASVFPFGDFSEAALNFLSQRAYSRVRSVLLSSKPKDLRIAENIETKLFGAIEQPGSAHQAIEETAQLLMPLMSEETSGPLFKKHAEEAHILRSLYRGCTPDERLALMADDQQKARMSDGLLRTIPAMVKGVGGELENIFSSAGTGDSWRALDADTQRTLVFLASHVDAPLAQRVRILLQKPGLLQILHDLPPEVQKFFAPITQDAAIVAGMVSETADVYALAKLNLPGWAQKVGKDVVNFFSVQGTSQSDGPRRPRLGRVGVFLAVLGGLLVSCVSPVGTQTQPPPGVGITPGPDTPTPALSLTPLSPDATATAISPSPTAIVSPWVVSDFAKSHAFAPIGESTINPSTYQRLLGDLGQVVAQDAHCQISQCNIQVANYDGRVAFALQAEGALYAGIVNPDGSLNRGESEWVPTNFKAANGESLTWGWFWDFKVDPQSGEPVPAGGSEAISRLGAWDKEGNVLLMHVSPFGEGVTQLLVKDPRLMFGKDFPIVEGRELVLSADSQDNITAGYFQYGPDGRILLNAPPTDAKGNFGKWRLDRNTGALTWEAQSTVTATPEPTKIAQVPPEYWGTVWDVGGTFKIPDAELWRFVQDQTKLIQPWSQAPMVDSGFYPVVPDPVGEKAGYKHFAAINFGCYSVPSSVPGSGGYQRMAVYGFPYPEGRGTGMNYMINRLSPNVRYLAGAWTPGLIDAEKVTYRNMSFDEFCKLLERNIGKRIIIHVDMDYDKSPAYTAFMKDFMDAVAAGVPAKPTDYVLSNGMLMKYSPLGATAHLIDGFK